MTEIPYIQQLILARAAQRNDRRVFTRNEFEAG